MSRTFESLRFHNYRLWFLSALVANIGTWMQRVAQDWLVLTHLSDDSGIAVGIVTGLQFAPVLFATPLGGLLADRVNRRHLLMATQSALGILAAALGILVLTDTAELWHVYVFALLLGTVSALDNPARMTFVGELVPRQSMANAVGLNGASFNAARLVGPGVAGLMIAAVGPGWVFIINAATFAATILGLALMRTVELIAMPGAPKKKGQLREAVRYVRGRPDIKLIMVVMSVMSALGLNFQLTSAVMAREAFDRGAGEYGLLGSILAIGSLTGALLAARRSRPRLRLVVGSVFFFGACMGLSALMPSYWLYAVSGIPVGFFATTAMNSANATVQLSTSPQVRGRVMSLYMMVFLGSTPIGSPLVGWIAETFGARWSVGVGAIASMAVALWSLWYAYRHWDVHLTYQRHPRPHLLVESGRLDDAEPESRGAANGSGEAEAGDATNRADHATPEDNADENGKDMAEDDDRTGKAKSDDDDEWPLERPEPRS